MRRTPLKRKPAKQRKRVVPKAALTRQCDALWKQIVKEQAGGRCEWCGAGSTEMHHMVARRRSAYLRHRLENGVALCAGCHSRFHFHESLTGWMLFKKQRPEDFKFVSLYKHAIVRVSREDLATAKVELESMIRHHLSNGESDGQG